jgi:hypothetical protein
MRAADGDKYVNFLIINDEDGPSAGSHQAVSREQGEKKNIPIRTSAGLSKSPYSLFPAFCAAAPVPTAFTAVLSFVPF